MALSSLGIAARAGLCTATRYCGKLTYNLGGSMAIGEEFRFRIEVYSPGTIPMARLAEYLQELAAILGETKAVHFVRLESGSTVVVHKIEQEAIPKVRDRAYAVARNCGPREAMRAYGKINRMLRADNGVGALQEPTGAEIIRFPGIQEIDRFGSITQQCSVDGEVVRIGGTRERVPIMLRSGEELIADCYTGRVTAKKLATHLFEPVRLFGTGRFIRDDTGTWKLEHFDFDSFIPLIEPPLSSIVAALRAIPGGEWGDDALDELQYIRHGPMDVQNGGV
jgi:hypothetical protein